VIPVDVQTAGSYVEDVQPSKDTVLIANAPAGSSAACGCPSQDSGGIVAGFASREEFEQWMNDRMSLTFGDSKSIVQDNRDDTLRGDLMAGFTSREELEQWINNQLSLKFGDKISTVQNDLDALRGESLGGFANREELERWINDRVSLIFGDRMSNVKSDLDTLREDLKAGFANREELEQWMNNRMTVTFTDKTGHVQSDLDALRVNIKEWTTKHVAAELDAHRQTANDQNNHRFDDLAVSYNDIVCNIYITFLLIMLLYTVGDFL